MRYVKHYFLLPNKLEYHGPSIGLRVYKLSSFIYIVYQKINAREKNKAGKWDLECWVGVREGFSMQ